jgi:hypothetical protein
MLMMLRIGNRLINSEAISYAEYDAHKVASLGIPNTGGTVGASLIIHFIGGGQLDIPREHVTTVWEELLRGADVSRP